MPPRFSAGLASRAVALHTGAHGAHAARARSCKSRLEEEAEIGAESEKAVRGMMEYKGTR